MKNYLIVGFVLTLMQCAWTSPACNGDSCSRKDRPASCICTFEYMPICGSDGKTYPNRCALNCQQNVDKDLKLRSTGNCQPAETPCICTFEYKPVCGSDGKTYPNECSLMCKKHTLRSLEIVQRAECPKKAKRQVPERCICTRNIEFVCGTDGKTYTNPCLLECAVENNRNLAIKHSGECDQKVKVVESNDQQVKVVESNPQFNPACICNKNLKPVCGSDGNTYNNECQLRCKQESTPDLRLAHAGQCADKVKVAEVNFDQVHVVDVNNQYRPGCGPCKRNLKPVCGSDGRTYSNECVMTCTSPDPSVTVVKSGNC